MLMPAAAIWRDSMEKHAISRRDAILTGAMAAGLAFLRLERLVAAVPLEQGEVVVAWLDQPAAVPPPAQAIIGQQLQWEELDSWITPTDKFFTIKHFGQPTIELPRMATRCHRAGQAAAQPDHRPAEGPSAPGGHLHAGVLGKHRPAVLLGWHRQRHLGRHAARAIAPGSGHSGQGQGDRLLRPRHRQAQGPRHGADDAVRPQYVSHRCDEPGELALLRDERAAAGCRSRRTTTAADARAGTAWPT